MWVKVGAESWVHATVTRNVPLVPISHHMVYLILSSVFQWGYSSNSWAHLLFLLKLPRQQVCLVWEQNMIHFQGDTVLQLSAFMIVIKIKLSVNPPVTKAGRLLKLCSYLQLYLYFCLQTVHEHSWDNILNISIMYDFKQNFPLITVWKQAS